jgi:hypothetical protein
MSDYKPTPYDDAVPPGTPDMFTVEEASRWLTCPQPVPLKLLQQLGKDCAMVSRLHKQPMGTKFTPDKPWPQEKTYMAEVIRVVFQTNPATAPFVPATTTKEPQA